MKVKITLILCLILSISVSAKEVEICKSKGLPEIGGSSVNSILSPMKKLSDSEFQTIKTHLCNHIDLADSLDFNPTEFKGFILDGLGVQRDASNGNAVVSKFLNDNFQKLICDQSLDYYEVDKNHLFKRAIFDGIAGFYEDFYLKDQVYEIDINGYEIVNGEKETVLDYLDNLIEEEDGEIDVEEYEDLRSIMISKGAKRGADL